MDRLAGPEIHVVAAFEETTWVMGYQGKLIWDIPEDLKRFKRLTQGEVVIMGTETCREILKKLRGPLPDRHNIVCSRRGFTAPGVHTVRSLDMAIEVGKMLGKDKVFVIGGKELFEEALLRASMLHLTLVSDPEAKGDICFPSFNTWDFETVAEAYDARARPPFRIITLKRKTAT